MEERETVKKSNKILILCDYYLPGYKSGGGMRTIVNMIDRFKDRYEFFIVTRDHDGKLDRHQYTTVEINRWNCVRGAKVFYLSKDNIKISKLRELLSEVEPNVVYCNSYFATLTIYLMLLKKLRMIPNFGIILAPCGELSEGALLLSAAKKKAFMRLAKLLDLYRNIVWKASFIFEKNEIEAVKGSGGAVYIAPDLLPPEIFENYDQSLKPPKKSGAARMIFLSRFMKKKNFKWLLENLADIGGDLQIDIYGPLEDAEYWMKCEQIIRTLPKNIKIEARGAVPHREVLPTLFKYHFFIMPTLGENFGHIFLESLAAGCPLVISDTTPWLSLEDKGIGWDLSLDEPAKWNEKINFCIDLDQSSYTKLSTNARNFAIAVLNDNSIEEANIKVLDYGLELS